MKKLEKNLKLLPNYYRKIGFALVGIVIIIIILSITKIIVAEDELLKSISGSILLIAFLLIALASNKIEDELTIIIRLRAFAVAFIMGVIWTATDPLVNLMFEGQFFTNLGAIGLLNTMFVVYFITVFFKKNSI